MRQFSGVRVTQVDEIAIMGENGVGCNTRRRSIDLERLTGFRIEWLGASSSLGLGKQGKGMGAKFFGP